MVKPAPTGVILSDEAKAYFRLHLGHDVDLARELESLLTEIILKVADDADLKKLEAASIRAALSRAAPSRLRQHNAKPF
mgnify:CR=1 FL=1